MSDFSDIISAAAAEAQSVMGELFTGPDSLTYTGVFRAASAFEVAAVGQEMRSHGYEAKTMMVVACTRSQFAGVPYDWRQKKLFRATPAQEFTILSINADDPNFFVFPLIFRQPA